MMRRAACAAVVVSLGGVGCSAQARITVIQPHLSGPQRELELTTQEAAFAVEAGQPARYCLAFPYPGAWQGRQFLLYLRTAAREGEQGIGEPLAGGGFVAGFFIQVAGQQRGLTEFVSGTVASAAEWGGRRVTVRLRCADGSQVTGGFVARRDELAVREFEERERPGDVRALTAPRRPG